jgi:hypothetical protein
MRGSDITNVHNEGANHMAGFLSYAEAESVGDQAAAQAILDAQVVDLDGGGTAAAAARAMSPVAEQLAEALRRRGLPTETSVGRSSFRIDIAVAGDGDEGRMGILLEPAPGASVHARFVAEAGVLEAFGWRILRVPLSDWYADPDRVVERIAATLGATGHPAE